MVQQTDQIPSNVISASTSVLYKVHLTLSTLEGMHHNSSANIVSKINKDINKNHSMIN